MRAWIGAVLLLAGCATTPTDPRYAQDNVECRAWGNAAAGNPQYIPGAVGGYQTFAAFANMTDRDRYYRECMASRGH